MGHLDIDLPLARMVRAPRRESPSLASFFISLTIFCSALSMSWSVRSMLRTSRPMLRFHWGGFGGRRVRD